MLSFALNKDFVDGYSSKKEPFGFNGLGSLVYHRTYSRVKSDGTKEQWLDTCERVINGMYSILRDYAIENNREWSDEKAQRSAQDAYDRLFNLKWSPPGRGLWVMGTDFVHERGIPEALQNCAFISTKYIKSNPSRPFTWAMEKLMLGVGVGFDTAGAGQISVRSKDGNIAVHTKIVDIADSREGWVDSVGELINYFLLPGSPKPMFRYHLIRPRGEPIRGFGGVASGPEPLIELHNGIENVLSAAAGKTLSSRHITDIQNMIGRCVVAGNVRRSAEIAIGAADDQEFLDLKNYEKNPERAEFGWASNNTVIAKQGMDYTKVVDGIYANAEPGAFWIDNARANGRMNGDPALFDDIDGLNPCGEQMLSGHGELCTLVETYPTRNKDLYDYLRTLKYAYLYGKAVTLLSSKIADKDSRDVMMKNRRIGTSLTGITQFIGQHGASEMRKWMKAGYDEVRRYDRVYSMWLGVPESIRVTTVKPSGSVSLLAGVTPGVHFPHSEYYIRRIRIAEESEMWRQFQNHGYHVEDDVVSSKTKIVSFPIHAGENIKPASEVTIWEQLSLAAMAQKYWSDNGVSVTVTFNPEKTSKDEIVSAMQMYEDQLKAVSFLPEITGGAYAQMPYEKISKEQYESMMDTIRGFEAEIGSIDKMVDKYCDGDACSIA